MLENTRCWPIILQNKTGMRCSWKLHCAMLQRIYQTKICRRIRDIKTYPGTTKIGPILDVFVSEDQGLLCVDIEVSAYGYEKSRGVSLWPRQSSEFAPKIEGPQSLRPSLKTQICASGDRVRFILKSHRHHPTDCTQASQILPGRASGDRLLSSHHQCTGKTHRTA